MASNQETSPIHQAYHWDDDEDDVAVGAETAPMQNAESTPMHEREVYQDEPDDADIMVNEGMIVVSDRDRDEPQKKSPVSICRLVIFCILFVPMVIALIAYLLLGSMAAPQTESTALTPTELAPTVEPPSFEIPFIFFHQRETGGIELAEPLLEGAMAEAANASDAPTFLACHDVSCDTYYTPQTADSATPTIYGGPFFYPFFLNTLHLLHNQNRQTVVPPKFTCLTIYREPVARIRSCWNDLPAKQNGTMSVDVLEAYLSTMVNLQDQGCLNEPMRIFSDFGNDEALVNALHEQPEEVANLATQQTIDRSNSCIVGVWERCQDTQVAIEKHLSWLAPFFSCDDMPSEAELTGGDRMTEEQVSVIERLAIHEQRTYKAANLRLDELIG